MNRGNTVYSAVRVLLRIIRVAREHELREAIDLIDEVLREAPDAVPPFCSDSQDKHELALLGELRSSLLRILVDHPPTRG